MNQLENCQARYCSNTLMGRTRTDGPDEFEPTKFDCNQISKYLCPTMGDIVFGADPVSRHIASFSEPVDGF